MRHVDEHDPPGGTADMRMVTVEQVVPDDMDRRTPTGGVFEIEATLPQFAEQGTWTLSYMVLRDDVGNEVILQPGDVDATGFPATFEVRG